MLCYEARIKHKSHVNAKIIFEHKKQINFYLPSIEVEYKMSMNLRHQYIINVVLFLCPLDFEKRTKL